MPTHDVLVRDIRQELDNIKFEFREVRSPRPRDVLIFYADVARGFGARLIFDISDERKIKTYLLFGFARGQDKIKTLTHNEQEFKGDTDLNSFSRGLTKQLDKLILKYARRLITAASSTRFQQNKVPSLYREPALMALMNRVLSKGYDFLCVAERPRNRGYAPVFRFSRKGFNVHDVHVILSQTLSDYTAHPVVGVRGIAEIFDRHSNFVCFVTTE